MDISKEENCKKIYEENKDIDILINNAGFGDCGHFEETSLDKDIQMIHTNIIAYHILTKLYLKEMIKKDSGKILNVASIAGFMPGPLMTTYYSTKNYVVRFSESIREELRRKKSKVKKEKTKSKLLFVFCSKDLHQFFQNGNYCACFLQSLQIP